MAAGFQPRALERKKTRFRIGPSYDSKAGVDLVALSFTATPNLSSVAPLATVALDDGARYYLANGERARYVRGTDARSPVPDRARPLNRRCRLFKTAD